MTARVRDLAASDPQTLNPIVGLLATANSNQSVANGTSLGQVPLGAVNTNQGYANRIRGAIANASKSRAASSPSSGSSSAAGPGSSQPRIGTAVKTIDQVEGVTEKGTLPVAAGSEVHLNELPFADRTILAVGPVTTIRLGKFAYGPGGGSGNVVLNASLGTFRFITGVQDPHNYEIETPYATMSVRDAQFYVNMTSTGLTVQATSGTVTVTTSTGTYTANAGQELTVSSNGDARGPTTTPPGQAGQFADLGTPSTNVTLADALSAFSAVTGSTATGATGGAGGGGGGTGAGGGSITGFSASGGGRGGGSPNFTTFSINTPGTFTLGFGSTQRRVVSRARQRVQAGAQIPATRCVL